MRKDRRRKGHGAIELLEQSAATLRHAPAAVIGSYCVGTLPFILGLLYFWTDMSKSPFAEKHLFQAAAGMSLLYIWMKAWQSIFAVRLAAFVGGEPAPSFTLRRIMKLTAQQAAWQPFSLFVLPAASLVLLPFGWAYAYFQNLSLTGDGEQPGFTGPSRKAWKMASLWSTQNHAILALYSLLWLVVFLNIGTTIAFLPEVIRMFTGIESAFTMSGTSLLNTTFVAVAAGLTYCCLNPFIKAVYVLRCFYGESLQTGADLKAELNAAANQSSGIQVAILLAAVLLGSSLFVGVARAGTEVRPTNTTEAPPSKNIQKVSPGKLNDAIDRVISQREYQWREPRKKEDVNEDQGALVNFLMGIRDWVIDVTKPARNLWQRFIDWLRHLLNPDDSKAISESTPLTEDEQLLLVALIAVAAAVLGLVLWRMRRRNKTPEIEAQAVTLVPDLQDENLSASVLPEEEWQALAADLIAKGELRLAMRALYMASLAFLAGRNLITIARYKSNRDYQRELLRRAREKEPLQLAFSDNVAMFERSWYGMHEVTQQLLETFDINHDRIRTFAHE